MHLNDAPTQGGRFVSSTGTEIVLQLRKGNETFSKDRIKKVSLRKASKRLRNARRGLLIGAGAGLAVGAAGGDAETTAIFG